MGNLLNKSDSSALRFKSPVNNAILDPFQGFDADVFVLDQGTGNLNLIGRFASIQLTIRNATEPYLELNQRVPRLLDGELQFGFVLERGMLDVRVLEQTFGYTAMTRELRNNRNTRFQITFNVNAPELTESNAINLKNVSGDTDPASIASASSEYTNSFGSKNDYSNTRNAAGRFVLTYCKIETLTIGVNAGRAVIANKWDGMAEGIEYVNTSLIDPGTYLNSASADLALQVASAAEQLGGTTDTLDAFPWDNLLYQRNAQNEAGTSRVGNPLSGVVSL